MIEINSIAEKDLSEALMPDREVPVLVIFRHIKLKGPTRDKQKYSKEFLIYNMQIFLKN